MGVHNAFFVNLGGAATLGSSRNPRGARGSSPRVLEPSDNVEHLLCLKHFARCFTLCFLQEAGGVGGWRKKQAGCQALKIVLKNDKLKLKKSQGGEFKETHWKLVAPM